MSDERAARRLGSVVGKYTLERVIGSGGMATVYEASHRNGNRVAVKMLKPVHAMVAEVRARFLREGYAANRVRHPGAVRVLDDDVSDDGLVFLVMELLEGSTLDAFAQAHGGKLPVKDAFAVGKQLLEVLAAAHAAGIVHRDIKPENVFLQTNGKLKVLDFGIARISSSRDATTTTTGRMLGTPAFMPPEQAYGRRAEVDARSDLWSVGATLFTAMTGRVVHHADTAEETLIKAATEPAPSLATLVPDIAPAVAAVVDHALMADRAARFQSAAEMLEALERAHQEAFGAPVASAIRVDDGSAVTADLPAAPRRKRALELATWGAPITFVFALVMAAGIARSRPSEPSGGPSKVVEASEPAATAPASEPAGSTRQIPSREPIDTAAGTAAAPPSPEPVAAPVAVQRASARAAVPRREGASPPSAVAPAAASATAPSRACGFEFDEEGRKWPKRCP